MPRVSPLVQACHPEPTLAVTALAAALAVAAGRGAGAFGVAAAFLAGQLSVGWSNDWVDAVRDAAVGRSDKPVARGDLSVAGVRTAALLALAACVPLSLLMGLEAGAAHLVAVAAAWQYNALLKSTVLSWVPYAVSFGLVPSIVVLGLPGRPLAPGWATVGGALLGIGAHFANVLPDLADDAATGVRGLPHRVGRGPSTLLAGGALVLATVALARDALGRGAVGLAVVIFVVGVVRGRRPGSRAAFLAVLVVAAVDVGLLVLRGASLAPPGG